MDAYFTIASFLIVSPIQYPIEVDVVKDFIETNKFEFDLLKNYLSKDNFKIAISIVAPEIGQHSRVLDFLEFKTLVLLYVQQNLSDFSIGPFQMKPSFAVSIEREVKNRRIIKQKYKDLLISGESEKNKRRIRVERLSNLSWQIKYLAAFIDILEDITKDVSFDSFEDKIQYWATLYNAGMYLDEISIRKKQKMMEFPYFDAEYNYSMLALAYYKGLNELLK